MVKRCASSKIVSELHYMCIRQVQWIVIMELLTEILILMEVISIQILNEFNETINLSENSV